ncbi:MAG: hypothetical protein JOZ32_06630 [Bryobacterales bacterium]|nr:hypothetical protein [Bryobacterales bacterium]
MRPEQTRSRHLLVSKAVCHLNYGGGMFANVRQRVVVARLDQLGVLLIG